MFRERLKCQISVNRKKEHKMNTAQINKEALTETKPVLTEYLSALIKAKDIVLSLNKKVHLGIIVTTTNQDHDLIKRLNELNEIIYSQIFR